MKRFYFLLLLFLTGLWSSTYAQKFQVDTLFKSGSLSNRINMVILGDGFTEAEMPKFREEAKKFSEFFAQYTPYVHYKSYFNFFAIGTPSKESGITNPGTAPDAYLDQPVVKKDTYYESSFGGTIHRLVTVNRYDIVYDVLAKNLPQFDLVVVLANTPWYGGSGGSIAVHTLHEAANLIGVHEIGHVFSGLSDEYWAGAQYGHESPNMTAESSPNLVKWRNWINAPNIGVFRHVEGENVGWYKPTQNHCLMEALNLELCQVCSEATTERILELVNPIEGYFPEISDLIKLGDQKTDFNLNLNLPEPNSLAVEWTLNGKVIWKDVAGVSLVKAQLDGREGVLSVAVFDSTNLSRIDNRAQMRTRKLTWALSPSGADRLVLIASNDSICAGEEATITAYGCNGTVNWSTGDTGKSLNVQSLETRTYQAVCTTVGAIELKDSITIFVEPKPVAQASNGGPYFEGSTIHLDGNGGETYFWQGPAGFASSLRQPSIPNATVNNAGTYQVTVSGKHGCATIATTDVKVDILLASEPGKEEWVKVFPNPAKDFLRFETEMPGRSQLIIYNPAGKPMIRKSFSLKTEVVIGNLPTGIYIFRISNGIKALAGKVAIQ